MKTGENNKLTVITPNNIAVSDWYNALREEIDAVRVETLYIAQETLLNGKLEIGKLIFESNNTSVPITALVQYLSHDLKIGERDLWYCVKFYEQYDKLEKLPEFSSKAISWNKVKKLITLPEHKRNCEHEKTISICICADCGKKIDN